MGSHQSRQWWRCAEACAASPPSSKIRPLNAADRTLRLDGGEELVTACIAVFEPSTGRFTYASAGHHPPLLRDPAGSISSLYQPDLPLGLRLNQSIPSSSVVLLPGSVIIMYTDGLIEIDRDLIAGERRLRTVFQDARPSTADLASDILDAIMPKVTFDDVAVLTLRYDAV
jgi:serine phosphatase RsbU (regulator of sigma subunit)